MSLVLRLLGDLLDWPPVWTIAAIVITVALARLAPVPIVDLLFSGALLRPLAYLTAAAAAALALWAVVVMLRARTSVIPGRAPDALVTTGPFRVSRNPIYLSDLGFLVAAALYVGSVWPLLAIPALAWILTRRFIEPEEAALQAAFPEAWRAWAARVGRWF